MEAPTGSAEPGDHSTRIAKATFECRTCRKTAGSIDLIRSRSAARIERASFTGTLTGPVQEDQVGPLSDALRRVDAGAVYDLDFEYAPFYCPQCQACYCGEHWDHWDVFDEDDPSWHDSVRGRCPQGHERMLED